MRVAALAVVLLAWAPAAFAQDSIAWSRVNWRKRVTPGDRFDLLLMRSFPVATNLPDSVPLATGSSGSWWLGVSINLPVLQLGAAETSSKYSKRLFLRLQPAVNFYRLGFQQTAEKRFPTPTDTFTLERERLTYLELGIGPGLQFKGRSSRSGGILVDAGLSLGLLISSFQKRYYDVNGQEYRLRIPNVTDANPLRAAVFARVAYRFVGASVAYRFTDVFESDKFYAPGARYPQIGGLEVGLFLTF